MAKPVDTPEDIARVAAAALLERVAARSRYGLTAVHYWNDASPGDLIHSLTLCARRLGYVA